MDKKHMEGDKMKGKVRTKIYYVSLVLLFIYTLISVKYAISLDNLTSLPYETEKIYTTLLSIHIFFLIGSIFFFFHSYIKVSEKSMFIAFLCLLIVSKSIPNIFWWYVPGIFSLFMNYLKQKKINISF